MKHKLTAFLEGLITYDYILFGGLFFLFLLFIILGILLRRKTFLAGLLVLLAFITLFVGPPLGYIKMHEYLFKNSLKLLSQKKLNFSDAVVVKGSVTNESKRDFAECKITASAYSVTKNKYKNYLKKLKPFKKMSIVLQDVAKGETKIFKIIVEPFTYSREYNISLGADCK